MDWWLPIYLILNSIVHQYFVFLVYQHFILFLIRLILILLMSVLKSKTVQRGLIIYFRIFAVSVKKDMYIITIKVFLIKLNVLKIKLIIVMLEIQKIIVIFVKMVIFWSLIKFVMFTKKWNVLIQIITFRDMLLLIRT